MTIPSLKGLSDTAVVGVFSPGGASTTLDVQAGGAAGDIFLIFSAAYKAGGGTCGPATCPGFTELSNSQIAAGSGQSMTLTVLAKRWAGTEGATFTISHPDDQSYWTLGNVCLTDADNSGTVLQALDSTIEKKTSSATISSLTLPAETTISADCYALAICMTTLASIVTAVSGWTSLAVWDSDGTGGFLNLYGKNMSVPGSTGTATVSFNGSNDGTIFHVLAFEPVTTPVPDAPTAVITTANDAAVSLSWTDSGSGITNHDIDWALASAPTSWLGPVATGSASPDYSKTGLTNGIGYVFRVRAVNASGTGAWSSTTGTVTPQAGTPVVLVPTVTTPSGRMG